MLSVFANAGFVPTRTLEGGVVEVRFPIEATEGYRASVDERDHVAVTASLRPFFEPRTVAVIGASARRGSIGGELFRNVLAGGFTGAAYPVNRSGEPVAGVRAYRSLEEIGDQIDLCVICLPGDLVIRRRRRGAPLRDALALRHLGRLRRDRARGRRAPGAAADARARPRRAARRPELPRHRDGRRRPQRDLCPTRVPARPDRLLVAVGRARARAARAGRGARARPLRLRLDRQQGRRLVERPARVVGGRPGHRPRPALRRVVRQPAQVRAHRAAPGAREAGARDEERPLARRPEGGRLPHRSPRRLRHGRRRGLPPGRRHSRRHARRAARRRRAALVPARSARAPRRGAHERRRARHPLRRRVRGRGARATPARRGDARRARRRAARRGIDGEPRRHARLGDRRQLPASRCRRCSPTPASTP